jgi:flagellar hook protein FlgE
MAFLRSLFAGVSGLRNHQVMMDVIGNNISNVNTVAFKLGRASFSELYAQTLRGAGRPLDNTGGTNPMQVGLGMSVNTLDTVFSQGSIESTTNVTDLAIQGNGFFIVNKGGKQLFTRAGRFDLDQNGRLVNPGSGAILQGKMADAAGVVPSGTSLEDIRINKDIKSPAKATTKVKFAGNLDSSAEIYNPGPPETGGIVKSSATLFDSLGNEIAMTLTFTKTGANSWNWSASIPDPPPATTSTNVGSGSMTFNPEDGTLQTMSGSPITITPTTGAAVMNVELDFGTPAATAPGSFTGITQSSGNASVSLREQDGYGAGLLGNISIDVGGKILGTFTNGTVQTLAQIMLAEFNNPGGLMRSGDNAYEMSGNSGTAAILTPGETSTVVAGALEQSNVDLADEFTKMIMAQRGFQASARVITTSDEFLQEVVNLKR